MLWLVREFMEQSEIIGAEMWAKNLCLTGFPYYFVVNTFRSTISL